VGRRRPAWRGCGSSVLLVGDLSRKGIWTGGFGDCLSDVSS